MAKSKTYALYLSKESVTGFDDILTETAKDKIGQGEVEIRYSKIDGEDAVAYIFKSTQKDPTWLPDIKKVFNPVPEIKNKSSCAVVFFKASDRIFATPFAHGWQYIDEAKIESDFGLKVAINSVSDGKLRRVDRNHLGQAMKGVSQSSFKRDLSAFGIDEALDLIRRVSGGSTARPSRPASRTAPGGISIPPGLFLSRLKRRACHWPGCRVGCGRRKSAATIDRCS